MKSYKEFAKIYDELMNDIDYNNWFSYIKQIFDNNNFSPNEVLEMACGTGSLTKLLCDEYKEVSCFDISSDMLTVAYDKLKKYRNVNIFNQDMTEYNLNKKFDSIVCICDSINYITDYEDLIKVFSKTYDHLDKNGLFIFDINSFHKLNNIIGNNTFIYDEDDVFYSWQNFYDKDDEICEFYLTFFIKQGEDYIRFDEEHYQKAYKVKEIINALNLSGFSDIKVYEGFTFNKPKDNSERINFVVKK